MGSYKSDLALAYRKTRLSQQARGSHKELAFGQALSAATKSINEKLEKGNRKL